MFSRFLKTLATWVYRHHVLVLILAALLTVVSVMLTARLSISSNIGSLLPEHTESIQVMKKASKRIGAMGYLMVVVEGSDVDEMKAFAVDFSNELLLERDKLRRQDKEFFVRFVDYKNPIRFFEDRFLLYLSLDDLRDIRDRISRRIKKEKIAANPFFVKLGDDDEDDNDGDIVADVTFDDMKQKYKSQYDVKGFSEWYLYDKGDQKILSILVLPTRGSSDLAFDDELLDFVGDVSQRVQASGHYPHIKSVELGGSYRNKRGQKESIRNDLMFSIMTTLIMLFIIITLFFRKLRAVWLILLPLIMAIFWTLAMGYLRFESLNMITAFIFAVLLGLGIDFGIHLLARYFEERRDRGLDVLPALQNMLAYTGRATWVGAITTMVAFFALTIADFKGFSEFGFLAGFGVLACIVSMLTVFPALLVFTERLRPVQKRERKSRWLKTPGFIANRTSFPAYRLVLLLGLAVLGLGLYNVIISVHCSRDDWCSDKYRCCPQSDDCCGGGKASKACAATAKECKKYPEKCCPQTARACCEPTLQFEYHFGKLRDKKPIGRAITKKYDKSFKLSLQPLNLLVEDVSQVRPVTDVIQKKIDTNPDTTIDAVRSLDTWIPTDQDAKQQVLAEISELIKPEAISFLKDDVKAKIDDFRPKLHVSNITLYQLPEKVLLGHSVVRSGFERILPLIKELLGDLRGDAGREEWLNQARMRSANLTDERINDALTILRDDTDEWIQQRNRDIAVIGPEAPRAERAEELVQRLWLYNERNIGILLRIYTKIDTYNAKAAMRFADEAGEIIANGERFVPAGEALIYSDTIRAMENDGMKAIIASALALLLILLIDFRSLRQTGIVLIPLVTGIAGMLAIMGTWGIKINFYNMIVITSIIGIGIDNGVHIFYRYREMGPGSAWAALRSVFGAVTLASVTTMIGFSGMLTANNRGLNSIGELAIIGMMSCWLAAVTVLPAYLEFHDRKLKKRKPVATDAGSAEAR